jgi:hypothetical protein
MLRNLTGYARLSGIFCTLILGQVFGQEAKNQPRQAVVPAAQTTGGTVVAHEIGQAAIDASGNAQLIGYFPYIASLPSPFFSGPPSEATAYFTFRSPLFQLQVVTNGSIMHVFPVTPAGSSATSVTYNVYYNSSPNQSFSNPASFSQGLLIGTFNSVKWMATITPSGGLVAGTFTLASSTDFTVQGQTYNLRNVGDSITLVFDLGPPGQGLSYLPLSIPFGGYGLLANGAQGRVTEVAR